MVPHVDFEFFGGLAALGAIVVVPHSVVTLRYSIEKATAGQKFDVNEAKEQSTQVGEVGYIGPRSWSGRLNRPKQGDEDQSNHKIFCFNADGNRKQHDFAFPVQQSEGGQNAKNAAGRAFRSGERRDVPQSGVGDANGNQSRADDAKQKEFQKLFAAPIHFELRTKHPQRQGIEQEMEKAFMQEGISDQLPYPAVSDKRGDERQHGLAIAACARCESLEDVQHQKNSCVRNDQPLHPAGEGRETQRHGLAAHILTVSVQSSGDISRRARSWYQGHGLCVLIGILKFGKPTCVQEGGCLLCGSLLDD